MTYQQLYTNTRPLFKEVLMHLTTIGLLACFSPTQFHVIALYIMGLILLDKRQNACIAFKKKILGLFLCSF